MSNAVSESWSDCKCMYNTFCTNASPYCCFWRTSSVRVKYVVRGPDPAHNRLQSWPKGCPGDDEGPTAAAPGLATPTQLAGKQTPDAAHNGIEFDTPVLGNVIQEEDTKKKKAHRGCWIMNDDPCE
ncbi:hypothetical protein L345_02886, partial [Ophiophagus hannah]